MQRIRPSVDMRLYEACSLPHCIKCWSRLSDDVLKVHVLMQVLQQPDADKTVGPHEVDD